MPVKSMISAKVETILQKAIAAELYAAHLYRHVANHLQRIGYFGAQKFFESEAGHEMQHYSTLAQYLNDRGSMARMPAIDSISEPISSLRDAFEVAFDTERQLEQDYVGWYESSDPVTQQFLLQFIEIQRKAVGEMGDLISRLDRCGDDRAALLAFDKELG